MVVDTVVAVPDSTIEVVVVVVNEEVKKVLVFPMDPYE